MSVDNIEGIQDVLTPDSFMGKGLAWPPREDLATGDFAKAEGEKSISECLMHLLTTVLGELSPMVTFGTQLDELIGSQGDTSFIEDILSSLRRSIAQNDNRLTVIDISYQLRNVTTSSRAIEIELIYRIVQTGKLVTHIFALPPAGVPITV